MQFFGVGGERDNVQVRASLRSPTTKNSELRGEILHFAVVVRRPGASSANDGCRAGQPRPLALQRAYLLRDLFARGGDARPLLRNRGKNTSNRGSMISVTTSLFDTSSICFTVPSAASP